MNERSWRTATQPYRQLADNASGAIERKFRLLCVACCRRAVALFRPKSTWAVAIDTTERYADGEATVEELHRAYRGVRHQSAGGPETRALEAVDALPRTSTFSPWHVLSLARASAGKRTERSEQVKLLRCVFGNPLPPVAFDASWRTDTVVSLARVMYESHDFGAMPIFADALQDTGCESADILDHCRDPKGVHVRGCWVVDLVLGKS